MSWASELESAALHSVPADVPMLLELCDELSTRFAACHARRGRLFSIRSVLMARLVSL